jgi:hypothetical protein
MYGISDNPFFDRSFLLTGATRGLGPDLARALAGRGARLIAVDDCHAALNDLAAGIGGGAILARDLSDPLAALELARWIATEHRDFAGMICNCTSNRQTGHALHARVIAPLSVMGILDRLLPARPGSAVALVAPGRPHGRDLARLAGALQDFNWNNGGSLRLTAAFTDGDFGDFAGSDRRAAAEAVLDAMACDRRVLRLRPGRARWRPLAGKGAVPAGQPLAE